LVMKGEKGAGCTGQDQESREYDPCPPVDPQQMASHGGASCHGPRASRSVIGLGLSIEYLPRPAALDVCERRPDLLVGKPACEGGHVGLVSGAGDGGEPVLRDLEQRL